MCSKLEKVEEELKEAQREKAEVEERMDVMKKQCHLLVTTISSLKVQAKATGAAIVEEPPLWAKSAKTTEKKSKRPSKQQLSQSSKNQ